jgi:hypothetical protein
MSKLSKLVKKANKFIARVDPVTKNNPDFVAVSKAFETGNWDKPFSSDANAWDYLGAAGPGQVTSGGKTVAGALDPEKPKDRAIGRTVGTVIADFWTFGAFSALAPKPEGGMQLESNDSGMAFGSLASPGTLSTTEGFQADASSVTPSQAALAQTFAELRRWTWWGVLAVAVIFLLKKGILK